MRASFWILAATLAAIRFGETAEPVQQLNQIPLPQLRAFLKGYNGDWRQDSDAYKGIPEPERTAIPSSLPRIPLPPPESIAPTTTLRDALANRRSKRTFSEAPISINELAFLLWSAQGVSDRSSGVSFRTAPSAGGRYPLQTRVFIRNVDGISPGLYQYDPETHALAGPIATRGGDSALNAACYGEATVRNAAVVCIWTATPRLTEWKYTYTAHRMIAMEAGHISQNTLLAATALHLAACPLLSYHQKALDRWLGIDGDNEFAIYLLAAGKPAQK